MKGFITEFKENAEALGLRTSVIYYPGDGILSLTVEGDSEKVNQFKETNKIGFLQYEGDDWATYYL